MNNNNFDYVISKEENHDGIKSIIKDYNVINIQQREQVDHIIQQVGRLYDSHRKEQYIQYSGFIGIAVK